MTDYDKQLLAAARKIAFDRSRDHGPDRYAHVTDDQLTQLATDLARIRMAYEVLLSPVTKAAVLDCLADFADMLGVRVPGDTGVNLYVAALIDLPAMLLGTAAAKVAASHRYTRLPLPADFLKAIEGEMLFATEEIGSVKYLEQIFLNETTRRHQRRLPL